MAKPRPRKPTAAAAAAALATRRSEVKELSRDILVSVIAGSGSIPYEQAMREIVRQTRVFFDELDNPTKRPVKKAKPEVAGAAPVDLDDDEGAELLVDDNLADS